MIGSYWFRFRRGLTRLITGQSLQGRLTLLAAFSVAAAVVLVGATAFFTARWSLIGQLDNSLLATASEASELVQSADEPFDATPSRLTSAAHLTLVSATGETRLGPGVLEVNAVGSDEISVARLQQGWSARTVEGPDGTSYRTVAVPVMVEGKPYAMVATASLTRLQSTLASLRTVVVVMGLVGVLVTSVLARLVARGALAPVRRLSRAVRSVTQTDQLNPIRVYGRDDLGELTKSFNAMLRSLQSSREQQRQLIADASHELRTPLTSMRTNVELLVADDRSGMLPEGARSEILGDVSAQLGEFSALIGDLVALTRDDHLQRPLEPLEFADVVESSLERAQRRGPGITFTVDLDRSRVMGDASTLERAVTNLLDNAIKFSPPDGTIDVTLHDGALTITDDGPGIAEEDLPHIFDRFYRSDRSRNTPGTGLGLSIVQHTADAHRGTVRASNHPKGGARFTLRIPPLPHDHGT